MNFKILILSLLITSAFLLLPDRAQAATATGTLVSRIYDAGYGVDWQVMTWTASTTASSSITMKVRTATTSDMSSAPAWDNCDNIASGADISTNNCVSDNDRYLQYRAYLSADYATATEFMSPELNDVEIKYDLAGALVSSPYNTLADDTVLSEVRWSETRPGTSDVLVQLRSSADGSSWTDWLGPDGTSADYFTDPAGGESLPASLTDGAGDQYLQYKIILDSNGSGLPVLSDITIDFSADIPVITGISPEFAGSNASGTLAFIISGSGFISGAAVKLVSQEVDIAGAEVKIGPDRIACEIDLSEAYGGPAEIVVTNPNGAGAAWSGFYVNEYRGTFVSQAYELPNLYFNEISWTAAETATATIKLKVRTDSLSDMSGASAWSACSYVASGTDISSDPCVSDGDRYLQYRAELRAVYGTSTGWFTPELKEVVVGYARWAAAGTLTSSPYDTAAAANAVRSLAWTESRPSGSDIKFKIRTAPDDSGSPGAWTDWLGPMEAGDYYKNADGHNAVNLAHNDGENDQWLQYKVFLYSDGAAAPSLSDIIIGYGGKKYSETIINDEAIIKDGVIFR